MDREDTLFPYPEMRPYQEDLVNDIASAMSRSACHIAHAPTGLGKTAAALGPAIGYAKKHDKVVFFLTSRNTQHRLALDTIRDIGKQHNVQVACADIIGKQNLCPVEGTQGLYSREFTEYCRAMREDGRCIHYARTRAKNNSLTTDAKAHLATLRHRMPISADELVTSCANEELCPYEMSLALAKKAQVIVSDYYYLFHPSIRETLLAKLGKDISDIIVVIDEGHNLPTRIRELLTQRMSTRVLSRAQSEAKKIHHHEKRALLEEIERILFDQADSVAQNEEKLLPKKTLIDAVEEMGDVDSIIEDLEDAADKTREEQKQSSIGTVASFLDGWRGDDAGYARILHKAIDQRGEVVTLSYQCLDPSIVTGEIIKKAHATVLMSGTLTPTHMYRDVLGFPSDTTQKEYPSPFPSSNRLVMVNPSVTTKYNERSDQQFENIARVCAEMIDAIPGNSVVFFPSYGLKKMISEKLSTMTKRTVLEEQSSMTPDDRADLIERFRGYQRTGAVLLAVTAGSFGEGIDMPGDELKGVLVVGLPLQPPTLVVKELIRYYDERFSKGWDYGYTLPAIAKSLQNAGRCIRTEKDKGVIAFLDRRYLFNTYFKCFPPDWNVQPTKDHVNLVTEFFSR